MTILVNQIQPFGTPLWINGLNTNVFSKAHPPSGFYVYKYLRENDSSIALSGTPYYIGKGSKDRAWVNHGAVGMPQSHLIEIVEYGLTEEEAFALEGQLISEYGRVANSTGILRNLTEGAGGTTGYLHTEEAKRKIGFASKGRPGPWLGKSQPQELREKRAAALRGKTRDPSIGKAISEAKKGKKFGTGMTGKTHSEEARTKMSNSRKGIPWTEARRKAAKHGSI